jgi:hypothetical protein
MLILGHRGYHRDVPEKRSVPQLEEAVMQFGNEILWNLELKTHRH